MRQGRGVDDGIGRREPVSPAEVGGGECDIVVQRDNMAGTRQCEHPVGARFIKFTPQPFGKFELDPKPLFLLQRGWSRGLEPAEP